jgi:hypothetical protein
MIARIRNKTVKHSKLTLLRQSVDPLTLVRGNVNIMGKSLLAVALTTILCGQLFGQSINSVTVSPTDPTTLDEVSLLISGDRWSSDVFISSISASQSNNSWTVDIQFMAGGIGLPVLVPFDTVVSLGTMAAGNYDCQVNGISIATVQDFEGAIWTVTEPLVGIGSTRSEELKFNCTPNPIINEAMLNLSIPKAEQVTLKVYDVLGQEVAKVIDTRLDAGVHRYKYFAADLNPGKYYFHLVVGDKTVIQPVLRK